MPLPSSCFCDAMASSNIGLTVWAKDWFFIVKKLNLQDCEQMKASQCQCIDFIFTFNNIRNVIVMDYISWTLLVVAPAAGAGIVSKQTESSSVIVWHQESGLKAKETDLTLSQPWRNMSDLPSSQQHKSQTYKVVSLHFFSCFLVSLC